MFIRHYYAYPYADFSLNLLIFFLFRYYYIVFLKIFDLKSALRKPIEIDGLSRLEALN